MTDVTDVPEDDFAARLHTLWRSGTHEVAVGFLRRAVHLDMTLRELAQALNFEHANEHLDHIRLGEVLRRSQVPAAQPDAQEAAAAAAPAARAPAAARRKRRGPEELEALREMVLERLRASMGSTTSAHLCEVLRNGGHDIDMLQMNRLLNQLETQGYVTCLGGKPKSWRLKPAGRTAPEPMQIRRAGSTVGDAAKAPAS